MKPKNHLFKYTFTVLSIMCCLLLISTSIIYAISDPVSRPANLSGQKTASATSSEATPSAAATPVPSAEPSESTDTGTAEASNSKETLPAKATPSPQPADTTITYPTITLSAVGDLMTHQSNLNNAYNPSTKTYNFDGFLEYIKPYLSKSDLTIGNFETVTAGPESGYSGYPSFNTPDAILRSLTSSGFDILSSANNHILDRGLNGLIRTVGKITDYKMINIGSSSDGKNKYIVKDVNGIKLGILSYSYAFNGLDKKLSAAQKAKYLSAIDEKQIKKDISIVKNKGADAVIVVMHWGTEYQREPNTSQTALAKKLFSWGADIILGSHPHVIQKSEIVKVNGKNKFVIYSMGNFISGYRRVDKANRPNKIYTEDGVVVHLTMEKDPEGGVILRNVDYTPTWVDKYYTNNRPVFKIIPIPAPNPTGKYITDNNRNFVKQSYKNTMDIMAKLNDK